MRPAVRVVRPVPPFPTTNVPATVTAPEVAVDGVRPVEPNVMLVTGVAAAAAADANKVTTLLLFL